MQEMPAANRPLRWRRITAAHKNHITTSYFALLIIVPLIEIGEIQVRASNFDEGRSPNCNDADRSFIARGEGNGIFARRVEPEFPIEDSECHCRLEMRHVKCSNRPYLRKYRNDRLLVFVFFIAPF